MTTFIGSRAFAQTVSLQNPGDPAPQVIACDLFRRGRNTDPGMDEDGTLINDWVLLTPVGGPAILPLAEVVHPISGVVYWVHGVPDPIISLLANAVDHYESKLKTVYRPRTLVDILRDSDRTDTDDLGDPIETDSVVPPERAGIVGSIVERLEVLVPANDVDLRTVTAWVGWVPAGTDVRINDKVRRQSDGATFRVEHIVAPVHTAFRELRLDLTRTA